MTVSIGVGNRVGDHHGGHGLVFSLYVFVGERVLWSDREKVRTKRPLLLLRFDVFYPSLLIKAICENREVKCNSLREEEHEVHHKSKKNESRGELIFYTSHARCGLNIESTTTFTNGFDKMQIPFLPAA